MRMNKNKAFTIAVRAGVPIAEVKRVWSMCDGDAYVLLIALELDRDKREKKNE